MNLTFVMATKLTSAANAIVLQFTEPIFLIIFLFLFWKHKPDKKSMISSILVFLGILCFFFDRITLTGQVGNVLAIISGALYAFVFLIKKMKRADFESSILISQITSFFLFMPWYFKETDYAPVNFLLVLLLGVVQMGIAYVCLAKGLETVSPITASLTSTIEPILNPVWVAIFYGELISPIAIVGAAIVIVSSTAYNILSSILASTVKTSYGKPQSDENEPV
jgi:drug/metabolite transporter (DMT)-like permease